METAIEWLEKRFLETEGNLYAEDFTKAKEMEKQQIIDAYRKGFISDDIKLAGDYYKETFKSE